MLKIRRVLRNSSIAVLVLSIFLCSFTTGIVRQEVVGTPFGTVAPINATFETPIGALTPVPTLLPTLGPTGSSVFVEGNWLIIGSDRYPIGDEFLDASELPIGASTESHLGDFGYADINSIEDYKLVWITDNKGVKHYIIVDVTDHLFIGHEGVKDGFIHYMDNLIDAENKIIWAMGGAMGGLVGATLIQFLACIPTAGVSCLTAIATAIGGGIVSLFTLGYQTLFKYVPAMNNLRDQFDAINTLRPKTDT
jgi:hypothetical protein